jgi:isocitrate dehydrogenase (NAD+)
MGIPATLIRGDGIGPEVVASSLAVLEKLGVAFDWDEQPAGMAAIARGLDPMPRATVESIRKHKICFKGPLGTPIAGGFRSVNVALRQELDLYVNLRPAMTIPGVPSRYTDVDLVIVRENTQGMYSGIEHFVDREHSAAEAVSIITRAGSERVARFAFDYARKEKRRSLTIAHKANILKATSGLFLETCRLVAKEFPDVKVGELIIDNMCMQLVRDPTRYDVIVTTNLFGDILSDLVAGLVGGLGVVPGANLGYHCAIFEAVHGTAPDIAGKGIANPAASMLAAGQMLRHLEKRAEADRLQAALMKAMADPATRTADLGGKADTATFTAAVLAAL